MSNLEKNTSPSERMTEAWLRMIEKSGQFGFYKVINRQQMEGLVKGEGETEGHEEVVAYLKALNEWSPKKK